MTKTDPIDRTADLIEARDTIDKLTRENAKLKDDLGKATSQLENMTVQLQTANTANTLYDVVRNSGVVVGAVPDVASKAAAAGEWGADKDGVFRLKDTTTGQLGKSVDQWLKEFKTAKPFYFSDFSGDTGEPRGMTSTGDKVGKQEKVASATVGTVKFSNDELLKIFDPKSMNLTVASQIYREDPALAARIAKQVGNKIFDVVEAQDKRFGR